MGLDVFSSVGAQLKMIFKQIIFLVKIGLFGLFFLAGCQQNTTIPNNPANATGKSVAYPRKPTVAEAKQELEQILKKAAPIGSSKERVIKWIELPKRKAARKFAKAKFPEQRGGLSAWLDKQPLIIDGDYTAVKKIQGSSSEGWLRGSRYKPSALSGLIGGMGVFRFRGSKFYAFIAFYLDKKEKLVDRSVLDIGEAGMKQVPGKPTLEEVRNMIKKEVPLGFERAKVAAWLDSKKIDRSDAPRDKPIKNNGPHPMDLSGTIQAIIREASRGFAGRTDITITFRFNKAGKLTEYSAHEIGTGMP